MRTALSSGPIIYCAIDTPDLARACDLARMIGPVTGGLKLGLEFFNAHGSDGVAEVMAAAPDASFFLDLKYHDIPNTVASAVRAVCSKVRPDYLNVHASGGYEMMARAKEACPDGVKLLAVTVLTSLDERALQEVGQSVPVQDQVMRLAELTQRVGLDGVVCSSHEIDILRHICGDGFILMVPGIRPVGAQVQDQKRIMTPQDALQKGASHLVIGRPITGANDPAQAARDILSQI